MHNKKYSLAVHGGAGTILRSSMTPAKEKAYQEALLASIKTGEDILQKGGSALDAVEASVKILEDCELFNAGKGSVYTHEGIHEMDASIMCGKTLDAGAVAMVREVKNPIALARKVLHYSPFVFLCGQGAEQFADISNIERAPATYFHSQSRFEQLEEAIATQKVQLDHSDKYGTVGAVALDQHGDLAAATSTGGLTNKQYGRIGDSALIGAGTYANNKTCAVSCTGYGEYFIRGVVAYDLSALMDYGHKTLADAAHMVIHEHQKALGGDGGLIAIDQHGNIVLPFNSEGMYRAWVKNGQSAEVAIYKD